MPKFTLTVDGEGVGFGAERHQERGCIIRALNAAAQKLGANAPGSETAGTDENGNPTFTGTIEFEQHRIVGKYVYSPRAKS